MINFMSNYAIPCLCVWSECKQVIVAGFRFFAMDSRYFQSLFALFSQSLKKRRCVVDRVTTAVVASDR